MSDVNFYTYKNGTKAELCKACMTLHINNWEPDTYLWLLEKFDVPYIEAEWNVLRDRAYAKDPYKINGMSVFGKYLSKMKLKQWKNYTWGDTERLAAEAEEKAKLYGNVNAINEEVLNYAVSLSKGKYSAMQYLNRVLAELYNAKITTLDEAKKHKLSFATNTKPNDKPDNKAAKKREYTKKELDSLFDNIDEIEI